MSLTVWYHTFFDAATAPGASTDTIIGTFGATATSDVIAAIAQTISLSQAAGAINITPGTVAGSTVPLTADVAGTAMNGKPVAGTAEAPTPVLITHGELDDEVPRRDVEATVERLLALQPGRYVETGPGRQLRAMLRKMDAAAFQACECATV